MSTVPSWLAYTFACQWVILKLEGWKTKFAMAISATIHKVTLTIADMDRHYYQRHDLTVARHPSENDLRLAIRLLAFAHSADERLIFSKGLCVDDEPEIWRKSYADEIELWIDFGQVDEKRIRKACAKSGEVRIYTYSARKADVWWQQIQDKLTRFDNLRVYQLHANGIESMIARKLHWQCNIQDEEMYISDEASNKVVQIEVRM